MTWLTALTACPAPIRPTCVIVRPIADRTGRACSTSLASPPTKIVSVAFRAPSLPPDTGASTSRSSRSARRAAKLQLPDGAIVEQSMTGVPGLAPSATPSNRTGRPRRRGCRRRRSPRPEHRQRRRPACRPWPRRLGQLCAATGRPVPGGDRKPAARDGGHRRAHRAEAEKGDVAPLRRWVGGHRGGAVSGSVGAASPAAGVASAGGAGLGDRGRVVAGRRRFGGRRLGGSRRRVVDRWRPGQVPSSRPGRLPVVVGSRRAGARPGRPGRARSRRRRPPRSAR